jgi:hypothetical protein
MKSNINTTRRNMMKKLWVTPLPLLFQYLDLNSTKPNINPAAQNFYALLISGKWLGGIRAPAQNLFILISTHCIGVLIIGLPFGGIKKIIFPSSIVLLISAKSTCRISITEKSCLVQNKLYVFHVEFMLTFHYKEKHL